MTDEWGDSIEPFEERPPLRRSFLRLVPDSLLALSLGDPADQRRAFDSKLDTLEDEVATLNEDLEAILAGDRYLTTPDRREVHIEVQSVVDQYETIRKPTWPFPYSDEDLDRLAWIRSELQSARQRIEEYNAEFVENELERHEDLFSNVDDEGNDLNEDQRKAVVRDDEYNQVIAGAGTGKTLTLTHRIAYLIERGVEPDRIAAITLTTNATDEIQTRLEERFDITDVEVETIHAFAYGIARETRSSHADVIGNQQRKNIVEEVIREKTTGDSTRFAWHYRQFLANYRTEVPDLDAYDSREEYVATRLVQSYETLAGEEVASQAEKTIADFLFTHGVEYQYEAIAEWADTAEDKGGYYPDFYLPKYDIYIEHWGIDESGQVAPWFSWSTEEYLEKLEWGRRQFASSHHQLVETYDFEHRADRLERALEHRLSEHGVELEPMDSDELVDYVLGESERKRQIVKLFSKFIDNAATFRTTPKQVLDRLPEENPRKYHFGMCGAILLKEYEVKKARNGQIDFDDMIYDAVEAVEEHPKKFQERYDHLLVDEFQDVSISQIELLQPLTDGEDAPHLFCVGDDWQSIYAFRGAVVEYFVDFEEYFGPAAITELRETYRCPETVLDASTDLIANNPEQIEKNPDACSGRDTTPRVHTLDGHNDSKYAERLGEYAANLTEQYLDDGSDPGEVMVLSRYGKGANFVNRVKEELEAREIPYDGKEDYDRYRPDAADVDPEEDGVSVFTAHQAKGREAAHVILLNVATGNDGFSPDARNDELLNLVRDVPANEEAEERRLFYVALTRTEDTLDLLTRANEGSSFLDEISEFVVRERTVADPGDIGDRVFMRATVERLWENTHESQRQAGLLEDNSGRIKFVSWESADLPMVREGVCYEFDGLKVTEYEGKCEIHLNEETTVRPDN
jgi:DNA helicase-4